ncbi:MAG: aminotransferase class V-fold PLP-dependent enzyme [Pseudomonadota bacterium]
MKTILERFDPPKENHFIANPSSIHQAGRSARAVLDQARKQVAMLVDKHLYPDHVIFTGSGSEANNLALHQAYQQHKPILISAGEHLSVLRWREHKNVTIIKLTRNGTLDIAHLCDLLSLYAKEDIFISIQAANSETGIIQDIKAVHDALNQSGISYQLHVDAVQVPSKFSLCEITPYCDCLSLSAHKIGGLQGVGALVFTKAPLPSPYPLILGGGHEGGFRGGTENLLGIAAMGEACLHAQSCAYDTNIQKHFERHLLERISSASIIGYSNLRLPNTTAICLEGIDHQMAVIELDLKGFMVSAGTACSSGKTSPAPILQAMGLDEQSIKSTFRVSYGPEITEQQLFDFIDHLDQIVKRWQ